MSVLAKDQLLVWANMLGFKGVDYKKELERTANIGTMFHGIVEEYMDPKRVAEINYEKYGVFGFKSELEATNAIQSFFNWYEGVKDYYKIAFTEKVVVGERFGGTIDCGIKGFIDKEKVIFVDYKTSTDFYMTQFLQLAGYVEIYEELYGPNTVEGGMVVLAHQKARSLNARFSNSATRMMSLEIRWSTTTIFLPWGGRMMKPFLKSRITLSGQTNILRSSSLKSESIS